MRMTRCESRGLFFWFRLLGVTMAIKRLSIDPKKSNYLLPLDDLLPSPLFFSLSPSLSLFHFCVHFLRPVKSGRPPLNWSSIPIPISATELKPTCHFSPCDHLYHHLFHPFLAFHICHHLLCPRPCPCPPRLSQMGSSCLGG